MLYSQRHRQSRGELIYSLAPEVRILILRALEGFAPNYKGGFGALLDQVGNAVLKKVPGLRASMFLAARRSDHPVVEHFLHCSDSEAMDFIELCFRQPSYDGGQEGVDAVNTVFFENEIGFELTKYTVHQTKAGLLSPVKSTIEYPRVLRRDANALQEEVIEPALQLLSDQRLQVANSEILDAFTALRDHRYEEAITFAGSAFESVMKTICQLKGWHYDTRDTCSKLVKILKDNNLFPSFYVPCFEAVGSVRNNLSSAHGRGPTGGQQVTREFAEHMVHSASAHILFLARRAGL